MKVQKRDHKIESGFIILLFALFFIAIVAALLLSVSFYRRIVGLGDENKDARGATTFIREMVHQNDHNGGISISEFEGLPCIRLEQEDGYLMYLYVENGVLRQLYVKESAQVDVKDGQSIMELESMQSKEISPGLFKIVCIDTSGQQAETFIAIKSHEEKSYE